jgi:hypothetical protein
MAKRPRVPRTRDWKAREYTDIIGRNSYLVVSGDVQVDATNQVPRLTNHVPRGPNPSILLLDLKIVKTAGIGLPHQLYKLALYIKRVRPGQYREVDIFFGRRIFKRIRVTRVPSLRSAAKKKKKKKAKRKTAKKKKRL